jgi:CBS domain-containing membrane protein
MSLLRCLHPPGGAAALTAVIGGQGIHAAGYGFALTPVGIDSVVLVGLAMVLHRATVRSYPHRASRDTPAVRTAQPASGLTVEDIDAALAELHESFDISRDDLDLLLLTAEQHALSRRGAASGANLRP